jgi:retron-type reverse transcriptase
MKRHGNLIEQIAEMDNLRLAFWKARKGKDSRQNVQDFRRGLEANLQEMRSQLLSGSIPVGDYFYFTIFDPKERVICAASFRERVLHHAIMNVCHPIFDGQQIDTSHATRPGKGLHLALSQAKAWCKHGMWFCKLDVRKFFDSIDHRILFQMLRRKFKDDALLNIFYEIIQSYQTNPGRGIPIGNLTSQYFANFYLSGLDHFIKENLKVKHYIRYMDDMLLLSEDKTFLLSNLKVIENFCSEKLRLALKPVVFNSVENGVPFLGHVVFSGKLRLGKASKRRYMRKLSECHEKLESGAWNEREFAAHVLPLVAWTRHADALGFRKQCLDRRFRCGSDDCGNKKHPPKKNY